MIRAYSTWLVGMVLVAGLTSSASAQPVTLPDGQRIEQVDFERHVQAILGKHGCNSGACHGSLQGRGGFYLSLFGYSAEKDHLAFTREARGRRINIATPESSLILLKASGQVPHGGEMRFSANSWQHDVMRAWVAGGASWEPGKGKVSRVEVQPSEHVFSKPNETQQLKVIVHFADGVQQDMTLFCDFRPYDDFVAQASPTGEVRSLRPGETPILVTYRGHIQTMRVYTPVSLSKEITYPKVPEVNLVDREVFAKLRKLNIIPSELSGDLEFLRRVHMDTIGCLPSPEESRAFLADKDPGKRGKKIEELLRHPLHAALWATKFCDITSNNVDVMDTPLPQVRAKRAKMWHDWFRKRIQENVPYDEIARGVLTATSRDKLEPFAWAKQMNDIELAAKTSFQTDYAKRDTLDLFWRRVQGKDFFSIEQMAELSATAFLGVRIECAQCHKHPTDEWTQADYRAFANVFAQVQLGSSPDIRAAIAKDLAERQKAMKEAFDVLDQEIKVRRKEAEAKVDQEWAPRRKAFEEMIEKDIAARREAAQKVVANSPPEKQKTALAMAEKTIADYRKKTQATFDKDYFAQRKKAVFSIEQDNFKRRSEITARYAKNFQTPNLQEIYVSNKPARTLPHPDTKLTLSPKALGGPELSYDGDAREGLHRWLVQQDNRFFARAFVNRVWSHYFGQGLVEPVDSFSAANPPSNEKLLDALAKEFADRKYDIRHIERLVLHSRTYQLSALPNETNRQDKNGFSRSYPRRPMAEVVIDVLNSALGADENFGTDVPAGSKAVELAPNRLQNQQFANIFRIFGRPPRTATCDCERAMEPALPQTLYLMTDTSLLSKMTKGRLNQLLTSKKTDDEIVDELFLATLTRFPTERERSAAQQHLQRATTRRDGFVNVLWALINTREFLLNH